MSDSLWGVALDWQAYLEEATAGLPDNAIARAVREELRAHLEEARRRLMAEEGLDAEQAAREAVGQMGAPQAVGAALRARHSVDWPRVIGAGAAAGAAGAVVFALGLHLLSRVVRSVITIGNHAVLVGRSGPSPLSLMANLAYAHALAALFVSLIWAAGVVAGLAAGLVWVQRGAGRRPIEFLVAVVAALTFAIALAVIERSVGALGLVHARPLGYGPGFFVFEPNPFLNAIYDHPPLSFVAWGWEWGTLSLGGVVFVAERYLDAALVLAGVAYLARRFRRRQRPHASVM